MACTLILGLALICFSGADGPNQHAAVLSRVDEAGTVMRTDDVVVRVRRVGEGVARGAQSAGNDEPSPRACTNIYSNTNTGGQGFPPNPGCELIDFGCSNGGQVCEFDIGYGIFSGGPGTIAVKFYQNTNGSTCPGAFIAGYTLTNLPGDGTYILTVSIPAAQQFNLPAGNFGYGYTFDNGFVFAMLASGGGCQQNLFWNCNCSPISFGSPWAGLYFRVAAGPPCTSPSIGGQPSGRTACVGGSVSFTVTASGSSLGYQWRRGTTALTNGGNISGATTATLTINPVGTSDAATNYNCVVSNTCGGSTSGNAKLTVPSVTAGDANLDSIVDARDIQAFVGVVINGGSPSAAYCACDMNNTGSVSAADVPAFVSRLLSP